MKIAAFVALFLWVAVTSFGRSQQILCAKHIESPSYPTLAWTARVAGRVIMMATIDKDGKVTKVESATNNSLRPNPILEKAAAEILERWIFAPPPFAPFSQTIAYDYEFDESLPAAYHPISKVSIDLPD